jgi:hypothetical protein
MVLDDVEHGIGRVLRRLLDHDLDGEEFHFDNIPLLLELFLKRSLIQRTVGPAQQ